MIAVGSGSLETDIGLTVDIPLHWLIIICTFKFCAVKQNVFDE